MPLARERHQHGRWQGSVAVLGQPTATVVQYRSTRAGERGHCRWHWRGGRNAATPPAMSGSGSRVWLKHCPAVRREPAGAIAGLSNLLLGREPIRCRPGGNDNQRVHFADRTCAVALGIGIESTKQPAAPRQRFSRRTDLCHQAAHRARRAGSDATARSCRHTRLFDHRAALRVISVEAGSGALARLEPAASSSANV